MRPVTFFGVLCVCAHAGSVNEGREYFEVMRGEFGIALEIQHCGCMVDQTGWVDRGGDGVGEFNGDEARRASFGE
ncbi:Pentatricopeptide repeat-containing protein [Acorus calamus]|uniref:Pentatricopeptide repeat-containing protein n=1 Tax=Acorus calamus TaxID=4465 RepID=A0AAV9DTQ8_ACOCL|nr:Pentatricopeptide repeat-containing protein [Acorus calamus]